MRFLFSKKILFLELIILALALPIAIMLLQAPQRTTPKASSFNTRLSLPTTLNASPNQTIDVPLFLNTGTASIKGVDVQIKFDTSILTLQDVLTDGKTSTSLHTFSPLNSSGAFDTTKVISGVASSGNLRTIEFSATAFEWGTRSSTGTYTTNGQTVRIATLRFLTKLAGTTPVTIIKNATSTTDSNISQAGTGIDILDFVDSLSLTIVGPTNTPIPTSTPTRTPTPLPTATPIPPTPTKSPTPVPTATSVPPTPTKSPTPIVISLTPTKSPTPILPTSTLTPSVVPSAVATFADLKTTIVNYLTSIGTDFILDGKRNMMDSVFILKKL